MLVDSALIFFILTALIVLCEWLATHKVFKIVGSVILVIAGGALLSNMGVIPAGTAATPAYDLILTYLAPLGIFYLLLDVKLADLRKAGLPMLSMFALGAAATVIGVLLGYKIWQPQNHGIASSPVVAGMYTGTYIGGSINLNAIALHYKMAQQGNLFALVNAVDNLIGTPWILATILLPRILHRFLPGRIRTRSNSAVDAKVQLPQYTMPATVKELAMLLALGFGTLGISVAITQWFPKFPSVITLTTIALILAQIPYVQKLKGGKLTGMFFLLLFLAVVGTFCNIEAVINSGRSALTLVAWVLTILIVHGLLIFGIGGLLKMDWDLIAVASNANIGGSISAPVCAAAINRQDLQVPGILAGSLGNAIGTYVGFWVVSLLQGGILG